MILIIIKMSVRGLYFVMINPAIGSKNMLKKLLKITKYTIVEELNDKLEYGVYCYCYVIFNENKRDYYYNTLEDEEFIIESFFICVKDPGFRW